MKTTFIILLILAMSSTSFGRVVEKGDIVSSDESHSLKILSHGLAALKERLDLISTAKKSIDLEYFIFNADESGKMIIQALIKKRLEGVKVRLLLDSMLVKGEINPYIANRLIKLGIEVKYYNELRLKKGWNNRFRNHRKMFIVDNNVAVTGGRNIGNEYFDFGNKYNFFDRDMVIRGELVSDLTKTFEDVWNSPFASVPNKPIKPMKTKNESLYFQDLKYYLKHSKLADVFISEAVDSEYMDAVINVGGRENKKSLLTSCQNLSFITEKPIANPKVKKQRTISKHLRAKIKNSTTSVMIESPYFTFSDLDEEALDVALAKNVQVSMLSNGANSTDVKITASVIDKLLRLWAKKGIQFSMYDGQRLDDYELTDKLSPDAVLALHAKTFIFDNKDIVIGTYNFDFISARFNGELIVECSDAPVEFIDYVKKDMEKRKDKSLQIYKESDVDAIAGNSFFYKLFKVVTGLFYHGVVN